MPPRRTPHPASLPLLRVSSPLLQLARAGLPEVPGGRRYHFDLDPPPSVNHLYPTVGDRRRASAEYTTWQDAARWELTARYPGYAPPVGIPCWMLYVTLFVPNWRKRDLDGRLKALIDLLAAWFGLDDNRLLYISAAKQVEPGAFRVVGGIAVDADA